MNMAIGGLAIASEVMRWALEKFGEIAAAFAVLCDRELYDGGTWRERMEYPVKRVPN